jgi:hypothetical protein
MVSLWKKCDTSQSPILRNRFQLVLVDVAIGHLDFDLVHFRRLHRRAVFEGNVVADSFDLSLREVLVLGDSQQLVLEVFVDIVEVEERRVEVDVVDLVRLYVPAAPKFLPRVLSLSLPLFENAFSFRFSKIQINLT